MLECGASVWIVYWRPFPMQDRPKHGFWEIAPGRAISSDAKTVCYTPYSPAVQTGEDTSGLHVRFVGVEYAHTDRAAAEEQVKSLPPPA